MGLKEGVKSDIYTSITQSKKISNKEKKQRKKECYWKSKTKLVHNMLECINCYFSTSTSHTSNLDAANILEEQQNNIFMYNSLWDRMVQNNIFI